jgi:hypothetical protein
VAIRGTGALGRAAGELHIHTFLMKFTLSLDITQAFFYE